MTPKEKAKHLYENYRVKCFGHIAYKSITKQCALIAVEEAEKSEYNVLIKFGFVTENYKSDYWQEVKNEIEKL
jgi:hypothetical protein